MAELLSERLKFEQAHILVRLDEHLVVSAELTPVFDAFRLNIDRIVGGLALPINAVGQATTATKLMSDA